jgi:hypothetical protein
MQMGLARTAGPQASGTDSQPPTEVCLTVDTEFSIGGAFAHPERYRPLSRELVDCVLAGRGEGLDFLLRTLRAFRVTATFFTEVLQCLYFGEGPMGGIVERIAADGHDVQLHLHPGWLGFRDVDWRQRVAGSDECAQRSRSELVAMIEFGIARFQHWGLAPPTALRAGSFACGPVVHEAMRECGLALGSNIGLAVYRAGDPAFHLASGTRMFENVLEAPVLSYQEALVPGGSRLRLLAITSTSSRETESLLWMARRKGISPVVLLTHPFEFIKHRDFRYREMREDRVNQARLRRLLDFLTVNRHAFATTTFAESGGHWLAAGSRPGELLRVPAVLALARRGQNAANTWVWRY